MDDMDVPDEGHRGEHRPAPVQRVGAAVAPVRVILAEDDVLLRSGFDVVGQAGDGAQRLALVRDSTPDLVLSDIRVPPTQTTEGLDAARVIRDEFPDIGILVLSAHVDHRRVLAALTYLQACRPDRRHSGQLVPLGTFERSGRRVLQSRPSRRPWRPPKPTLTSP